MLGGDAMICSILRNGGAKRDTAVVETFRYGDYMAIDAGYADDASVADKLSTPEIPTTYDEEPELRPSGPNGTERIEVEVKTAINNGIQEKIPVLSPVDFGRRKFCTALSRSRLRRPSNASGWCARPCPWRIESSGT